MGAYDGAEVAELVGLLILQRIKEQMPGLDFGLYRDDGLAVCKTLRPATKDSYRKRLIKLFAHMGLKITLDFGLHEVNFLDVTLNLADGTYKPYRKPNDLPIYINTGSNHPPSVKKELPAMISKRLSSISSSEQAFNEAAPLYNTALEYSGYKRKVHFCRQKEQGRRRPRTRKRNIIWYNPPFNAAVTTNLGKKFLQLIDKHFPPSKPRSDNLHKVINRHCLKLSYSCTPNVSSIITNHNSRVMKNSTKSPGKRKQNCNCQKPNNCPLQGNCLQEAVVYKATVTTPDTTKVYIGSTELSFKQRWYGHKASRARVENRTPTALASYVWNCKDAGHTPEIKWPVVRQCSKYKCGTRRCDICLSEKLLILRCKEPLLNKRTELMSRCLHMRKWRLKHGKLT